jgi:AraC-like DNA-binding protein
MSDTLRKETGKNAQDHIYYFLIDKAKTKLLNTQESVSQIAYSLGFNYPNHFSKVFRNKTGMSPIEYRNLELKKTIKL